MLTPGKGWFAARPAMEQAHIDHAKIISRVGLSGPRHAAALRESGVSPALIARIEGAFTTACQALKASHAALKAAMEQETQKRAAMEYREKMLEAMNQNSPATPRR